MRFYGALASDPFVYRYFGNYQTTAPDPVTRIKSSHSLVVFKIKLVGPTSPHTQHLACGLALHHCSYPRTAPTTTTTTLLYCKEYCNILLKPFVGFRINLNQRFGNNSEDLRSKLSFKYKDEEVQTSGRVS